MNQTTFERLKSSISEERLAVYNADGADNETALATFFSNPDWNNVIPLTQTELAMITDAQLKIKRNGKKYSHGRLVAELTLGFWVALMGRKYNTQSFQFAIIKNCLHGCPAPLKKSSTVQKNLTEIRFLRNRIAHHERICHWKDLKQKHDLLLDFICWLNSDMHKVAIEIDTFDDIFKNGVAPFLDFVRTKM